MPVSPDALAAMGRAEQAGYSNSKLVEGVILAPLTDLFAMPMWVPFANVFSVGDLLIGAGIVIAIVTGMRATDDAGATDAADAPSASTAEAHGALTH
jgi:galactitol-specific phosphotransferase system IIC component